MIDYKLMKSFDFEEEFTFTGMRYERATCNVQRLLTIHKVGTLSLTLLTMRCLPYLQYGIWHMGGLKRAPSGAPVPIALLYCTVPEAFDHHAILGT